LESRHDAGRRHRLLGWCEHGSIEKDPGCEKSNKQSHKRQQTGPLRAGLTDIAPMPRCNTGQVRIACAGMRWLDQQRHGGVLCLVHLGDHERTQVRVLAAIEDARRVGALLQRGLPRRGTHALLRGRITTGVFGKQAHQNASVESHVRRFPRLDGLRLIEVLEEAIALGNQAWIERGSVGSDHGCL
jgi:hypothetical protein